MEPATRPGILTVPERVVPVRVRGTSWLARRGSRYRVGAEDVTFGEMAQMTQTELANWCASNPNTFANMAHYSVRRLCRVTCDHLCSAACDQGAHRADTRFPRAGQAVACA